MCHGGGGEETAEHIAMRCRLDSSRRYLLWAGHGRQQSLRRLIGDPSQAKRLTKWLIETGRIKQVFQARKLLFSNEQNDEQE